MNALTRFTSACLALAVLLSSGCGGGGSYGGQNPPVTPPPTGGITRTGIAFAEGPITGFGSVIVNGVTYDTSAATVFTKDGLDVTQDDFSVGQVVLVKGSIDDNNSNASADSVEFNDSVEGPVSSVDSVTDTIVVLGQTVLISATTSIDDSCPGTLDALLTVVAVEVSGLPNTSGVIEASRIECRDGTWDGVMEVNGIVSGHNAGAMTFMINALEVSYGGAAAVDNFPTAGIINDGDPVEAKGTVLNGNTLIATRVEYKGNRFDDNAGDHMEVEGFITRFVSATDFDVSGIPVTTIATTNFVGGAAGDLGLNLKVEVEGEFDSAGVLNATKVEIKTATAIRVTGRLDSVTGNTLVVLGITVNTDAIKTRFEDKVSGNRVDPLHVTDLNMDDYVAIRGQELPAGQITALIVEREDPDDSRIELRGFVEAGGAVEPTLTVLGVTIQTGAGTVFKDTNDAVMSSVDFWAAVQAGSLVNARGTESAAQTIDATADEVQLEME